MTVRHSWDDAPDEPDTKESFDSNGTTIETVAISALRAFAWLDLGVGVIGGFLIVAMFAPSLSKAIAILIGVGVFMQGLFGWALFLVLASIATNLITIKENTTPKPEVKK